MGASMTATYPPLPIPNCHGGSFIYRTQFQLYTAEQMRDYVDADRAALAAPATAPANTEAEASKT